MDRWAVFILIIAAGLLVALIVVLVTRWWRARRLGFFIEDGHDDYQVLAQDDPESGVQRRKSSVWEDRGEAGDDWNPNRPRLSVSRALRAGSACLVREDGDQESFAEAHVVSVHRVSGVAKTYTIRRDQDQQEYDVPVGRIKHR